MTYHPLTNDSGSSSPARMVEEARDLCRMLADYSEELRPNERAFVEKMAEEVEGTFATVTVTVTVTVKQLLWLRDLWGRFA